jgi:hypothetical protein
MVRRSSAIAAPALGDECRHPRRRKLQDQRALSRHGEDFSADLQRTYTERATPAEPVRARFFAISFIV